MKHLEFRLQKNVCQYLRLQYPNVMFLSDAISNIKLTKQQQRRNKQIQANGFSCPDVLILQTNKYYSGLFIELKIVTPFKKNGEIKASKDDHLKDQLEAITSLNQQGYNASFQWEFDKIIALIDSYMRII